MATTYAALKQDIQDWMENDATEFTDEIDTFIDMAELRIQKDLDLTAFRGSATAAISQTDATATIPTTDTVIAIREVTHGTGTSQVAMLQKDESFMYEFNPGGATEGTPRYWAPYSDTVIAFAPAASASGTLTFYYSKRLTALSASNTTNYLTTNYQDALLYAALIEAAIFMKEEAETLGAFNTKYQEAIGRGVKEETRILQDRYRRRN